MFRRALNRGFSSGNISHKIEKLTDLNDIRTFYYTQQSQFKYLLPPFTF